MSDDDGANPVLVAGARLVTAVLGVVVCAACTSAPTADGALGDGGAGGEFCVSSLDGTATFGSEVLAPTRRVSLRAATLEDADGLELVSATVHEVEAGRSLVGLRGSWPPGTGDGLAAVDPSSWSAVAGAELSASVEYNLVVAVRVRTGGGATAGGIRIEYEDGGKERSYLPPRRLRVVAAPAVC